MAARKKRKRSARIDAIVDHFLPSEAALRVEKEIETRLAKAPDGMRFLARLATGLAYSFGLTDRIAVPDEEHPNVTHIVALSPSDAKTVGTRFLSRVACEMIEQALTNPPPELLEKKT